MTTCLPVDIPRVIPRLSSRTNLVGVVGPTCLAESQSFIQAMLNAGKVVISPTIQNTPPIFGAFQFFPSIKSLAEQFVEIILRQFPHRKIYLVADARQEAWLVGLRQAFQEQKITVAREIIWEIPSGDGVEDVNTSGSDSMVIFIVDDTSTLGNLNQIKSAIPAAVIFTPYQFIPTSASEPIPEGWYRAGFLKPSATTLTTPRAAASQDAVLFLLKVVEQVSYQSPDGRLLIPRRKLQETLQDQNFSGLMGQYICSQAQACAYWRPVQVIPGP